MKEIFDEQGHITKDGFEMLRDDKLTEIERLEISEHLSFCDNCIEKYTEFLSNDELLVPPETFAVSTLNKIKKIGLKIAYNRYFSIAIAASFAIFLWISGFFNINVEALNEKIHIFENGSNYSITNTLSTKFNSVINNVYSILNNK